MSAEMSLGHGWEYGMTKFATRSLVNASQYARTNNILNCCIDRTTTNVVAASRSSSSPTTNLTTKLKSDIEDF